MDDFDTNIENDQNVEAAPETEDVTDCDDERNSADEIPEQPAPDMTVSESDTDNSYDGDINNVTDTTDNTQYTDDMDFLSFLSDTQQETEDTEPQSDESQLSDSDDDNPSEPNEKPSPVPVDTKSTSKGFRIYAVIITAVAALLVGILIGIILTYALNGSLSSLFGRNADAPVGITEQTEKTGSAISDVLESVKQTVVVIEVESGNGSIATGTGVIVTESGYIVTNHHVIDNATKIRVTFYDGTYDYADIIGSSEMDDIGVIKVNKSGLPFAAFADSARCTVGQTVYAVGMPAGSSFSWTVTRGIISYVDREIKKYNDDGTLAKKLRLIQTDAIVNPGNSGGPLVDENGHIVGIVSMRLAGEYLGIGFAIPSDGAVDIIQAIIQYGNADSVNSTLSFKRPVLGIVGVYVEADRDYALCDSRIYDVTGMSQEEIDITMMTNGLEYSEIIHAKVSGIYVTEVTEGKGAFGVLNKGDIIMEVEGETFESMLDMMDILNEFYAGDSVAIRFDRNGQEQSGTIVLSAYSE